MQDENILQYARSRHYNFEIHDCGVKCTLEELFLGPVTKDISPVQYLIQAVRELEEHGCNIITAEQSNQNS